MTLFDQPADAPTRRIVEHLQRHGPTTIRDLEQILGVTTTAVRAHLSGLLAEGYIERRTVHQGVGRPHHAYGLTDRARELYACHCDDLALTLLQEVFTVEGVERATYLLSRVGDRLAKRYAGSVRAEGLRERVEQMAAVLQKRGVLTDVETLAEANAAATNAGMTNGRASFDASTFQETDENALVLKAYNCPFHELAQEHREICAMDERMLHTVLGADVQLQSCIMDGSGHCSFVVRRDVVHKDTAVAERGSSAQGVGLPPDRPAQTPPQSPGSLMGRTMASASSMGGAVAVKGFDNGLGESKEGKKKKKHKKGK